MPIETVENRRLYRQIADQISRLIETGEYPPGSRLPPERMLAIQLNVSRPTVREALIALEVEGWVDIRGGTGVFVLERQVAPAAPGEMLAISPNVSALPAPGPLEVLYARDLIEPEIAAYSRMIIFGFSAMVSVGSHDISKFLFRSSQHASIADTAKIFAWKKRKAAAQSH